MICYDHRLFKFPFLLPTLISVLGAWEQDVEEDVLAVEGERNLEKIAEWGAS